VEKKQDALEFRGRFPSEKYLQHSYSRKVEWYD
jgi:hypothetical protein